MTCASNNIKELLPAYLRKELDETHVRLVEAHLASCDDCRTELSLVGMMSEEAVPDPGETFWAQMPAAIDREVRRHREKKRFGFSDLFAGFPFPGPAWATAAVLLIVAALWFVVRPVPVDIASNEDKNGAAFEDLISGEEVNPAELSSTELQAAGQWARNEFGRIGRELTQDNPESTEQDVSEDISNLSPEELDRLYEILKKKEQSIRKMRLKTNEVSAG